MRFNFRKTSDFHWPSSNTPFWGCWGFSAGIALLLSGCSALNFNTRATLVVSHDQTDSVLISTDEWSWEKGFYYQPEGLDSTVVRLDNSEAVHLIRAEKPGHFPSVTPLFPDYMNPLKALDLGLAIGGALTTAVGLSQENGRIVTGTGIFTGFFNGLGLFAQPKRVYAKHYTLPSPPSMPKATPTDPMVRIEGFHMRIPEGGHSWKYFEDMSRYDANKVQFVSASEESVEIQYSNLDEDLSKTLQRQGFQPEATEGMFHRDDAVQISGELNEVQEHRVQSVVRYQLSTNWWVYNSYGMSTDTIHIDNLSNWALYNFSDPGFDRDLVAEALTESMFIAIENPRMFRNMRTKEDLEGKWTENWETIHLPYVEQPAGKVSKAIASVVTIDAADGHGSGCIISENGYIVTNHHVVSDTSLLYTVYFQDGRAKTAKIVRYHPVFDLALLQVDTTGLQPFHIDLDETIDVGEETYAMGTPYDIDLGASVTKGIISGKRKDGTRTLIQTDVSISPGNSGGALVDSNGTLIGVVNEKVLGMGVEGIGFAIPAHFIEEALMIEFNP